MKWNGPLRGAMIIVAVPLVTGFWPWPSHADSKVEFNRDVRPIIADKCFACHGPDEAAREEDLRLDLKEGLFGKAGFGQAIVSPGDPEESEIYYRISNPDPDERMPPEDFHLKLSDDEIETIKRWIEQGAPWEGHWAFIPPTKPPVPAVSDTSWVKNEIDHFILDRLDATGLKPSRYARKEILIRRVSLDLTGLPPTLEEVDDFLADRSDDAYERVVDRLLASPHYGERMSFVWLDAARYSDTNGYQRDTKRTMWIWRDWVINAFNDNMPFDQFTIEQLAGDLIPGATLSQKIATGFNRNHRINGEGGIIPEEYAVEYVVDRVATTSTTWMGLTMGCARCHDHKFDPISQREFYEMYAFFNQVPEEGKGAERGNDKPFIQVPTPEDIEKREQLVASIQDLKNELFAPDERLDRMQSAWEEQLTDTFSVLNWRVVDPIDATAQNGTTLEILEDHSILATGPNPDSETHTITFEATEAIRALKLEFLLDERLPESGPGRGPIGNVVLTDFEVYRAPAASKDAPERLTVAEAFADFSRMDSEYRVINAIDDDEESGWSTGSHIKREDRTAVFVLDVATPIAAGDRVTVTLDFNSQHAMHNAGRFKLSCSSYGGIAQWVQPALGPWHHVGPMTGDAGGKELLDTPLPPEEGYDREREYADGTLRWQERPDFVDGAVNTFKSTDVNVHYLHRTIHVSVPTSLTLSLGSDDAIKVWIDGEVRLSRNEGRSAKPDQEILPLYLQAGDHEILMKIVNFGSNSGFYFEAREDDGQSFLSLLSQLAVPMADRTDADKRQLLSLFRMQVPQWLEKSRQIPLIEKQVEEHEESIVTTMIMEDMETPRDTYLLVRGAYDNPDTSEKLFPSVQAILGEMDDQIPRNRLGFAQWLMDARHPLTARVRVNHYWQMYFGQGIVKTSEDFGTQGSRPTHPDLLDWLAVEFIESGWDVKAMQKKIVMSATYRQSSKVTEELLAKDPENLLLARAPRFRLPAETIRDQALKISGLLNLKIGGPSVKPYQPDKMWSSLTFQNMDENSTNFYTPDTGDKLYRRGLYTFWKRTIAPPRMQIFDASDRERCSMRTEITNTPMQAMVLLNDPTYIEASRHLARRMIREGGKRRADRIRYGYRLALACEPGPERQQILGEGLKDYKAHFKKHREDAQALIAIGDSDADQGIRDTVLAAYTMLASVILNLDEVITRE